MDFETCFRQSRYLLLEGALGERLKREYGLKIDGPAAIAPLITQPAGRAALRELWGQYRAVARRHCLPFLATTPTRRANRERTALAGYDAQLLRESVAFLREVREQTGGTEGMYIGALMGCRGDAYLGDAVLPSAQAKEFHSWAADIFAEAGAEFLYAGIMPALQEAIGMAQAMEQTGLPYIISFMIRKNGRLIDGTPISQAIAAVDASVDRPPLCFMTNCVHPAPLRQALLQRENRAKPELARFLGIQANASPLSPPRSWMARSSCSARARRSWPNRWWRWRIFNPLKFLEVAAGWMKPIWKHWHGDWKRSFKKGKAMAFPFFMEGKIPVRAAERPAG